MRRWCSMPWNSLHAILACGLGSCQGSAAMKSSMWRNAESMYWGAGVLFMLGRLEPGQGVNFPRILGKSPSFVLLRRRKIHPKNRPKIKIASEQVSLNNFCWGLVSQERRQKFVRTFRKSSCKRGVSDGISGFGLGFWASIVAMQKGETNKKRTRKKNKNQRTPPIGAPKQKKKSNFSSNCMSLSKTLRSLGQDWSREKLYTPPPPSPHFGQKAFLRGMGGGGVYFEGPPGQDFIRPPSLYAPHPLKGIFRCGGVGVYKIWPRNWSAPSAG